MKQFGLTPFLFIAVLMSLTMPALAKTAAQQDNSGLVGGLVFLAVVIGSALVCGFVAAEKYRNPGLWILAGLFFNVFAVIGVLMVNSKAPKTIPKEQQQAIDAKLTQIRSGQLVPFQPQGIMPVDGEKFYWEQPAEYGTVVKQHRTSGSAPAVYVPLGHGMRMRVGGWQGQSQTIQNFAWVSKGTVYVSNARILFKADDGDIAQAGFSTINTYDAFPDGLGLNVSKIGVMQFKTGDPCLGEIFLKLATGQTKEQLESPAPAGDA